MALAVEESEVVNEEAAEEIIYAHFTHRYLKQLQSQLGTDFESTGSQSSVVLIVCHLVVRQPFRQCKRPHIQEGVSECPFYIGSM